MTRDEIKNELNELLKTTKRIATTVNGKKHRELKNNIIEKTSYLADDSTIGERIYHVLNDLYEVQKCIICKKNKVTFNINGYRSFCSATCRMKDPDVLEKTKQTNIKKFGVENPLQNKEVQEKRRQTSIDRHGVEYAQQNKEIKEKANKTFKKNYSDNPEKLKEMQEKSKQTWIKNYGVDNPMKSKEIQEKSKQTCLENYGVDNPMKSIEVREKLKNTIQDIYGVDNPMQNKEVQENLKNTIQRLYNVDNICQSEVYLEYIESNRKIQETTVKEYLKTINIKLIGKYLTAATVTEFECLKCGKKFESSWFNIQQGKRCPYCSTEHTQSKNEIELFDYLKIILYGFEIIQNETQKIKNPKTNYPLELDIYIPEKKIAIEFDGLYWHSEQFKDKDYHLLKTNLCKEKGIRLIHIFEDEWNHKKDIVKSKLKQILGINDNERIDLNDCDIKEIDVDVKNEFLDKFHIDGVCESSIKLGAFYNNELVAVMTFSETNDIHYYNRFCINLNYHIPGITIGLLEYFKRNYIWKEICAYADLRWDNGKMYDILGFELVEHLKPKSWYIDKNKSIRTNHLLLEDKKYLKIYDCGSLKYKLENDNDI